MSDLRTDRGTRPAPPPVGGPPDGPKRMITAGIALAAVAVFGVGIWFAYDQGVKRGASGAPPLVRADQGPTKVAPENPGGMQIPNTDRAIYERLGGNQTAVDRSKPEQTLPPPERPNAGAAPTPGPAVSIPNRPNATAVPNQTTAPAPAAPAAGQPAPAPRTASVAPIGNAPAASSTPAAPRPAAPTPTPAAPQQAARTTAPATGGTARVQLASLKDQKEAQAAWAALQRKFPADLGGLSANFERVDLGDKGVYFRLQAGPLRDRAAAQALCEKLSASRQGCIVVGR